MVAHPPLGNLTNKMILGVRNPARIHLPSGVWMRDEHRRRRPSHPAGSYDRNLGAVLEKHRALPRCRSVEDRAVVGCPFIGKCNAHGRQAADDAVIGTRAGNLKADLTLRHPDFGTYHDAATRTHGDE